MGGKAGVHVGEPDEGKEVTLSRDKNEILLTTDMPFSKRLVAVATYVYSTRCKKHFISQAIQQPTYQAKKK